MTTTYKVLTQHDDYLPDQFIVPVEIEAETPHKAARARYDKLANRRDCKALLVLASGNAWVFPVGNPHPVSDAALLVGA